MARGKKKKGGQARGPATNVPGASQEKTEAASQEKTGASSQEKTEPAQTSQNASQKSVISNVFAPPCQQVPLEPEVMANKKVSQAKGAATPSNMYKGKRAAAKPNNVQKGKAAATEASSSSSSSWRRGPFCLLLGGEQCMPLLDRLKEVGEEDIMTTKPPPGEPSTVLQITGTLKDPAKLLLFRLIAMVFRELDAELCFESLQMGNLFVNRDDVVKIRKDVTRPATSDKLIEETVHSLGNVIFELVSASSPLYASDKTVNPELRHLLGQMKRYKAKGSTFLMRYHSCNVPDSNRGYYYIFMFDETMDILSSTHPRSFEYVVNGTDVPPNWHPSMETNSILKEYMRRGNYDYTAAKPATVPALVPLKCLRHIPSHGREDAGLGDPNVNDGILFTRSDVARAVYHRTPMAVCSMAKSLDGVGRLSRLGLENLFPGQLKM